MHWWPFTTTRIESSTSVTVQSNSQNSTNAIHCDLCLHKLRRPGLFCRICRIKDCFQLVRDDPNALVGMKPEMDFLTNLLAVLHSRIKQRMNVISFLYNILWRKNLARLNYWVIHWRTQQRELSLWPPNLERIIEPWSIMIWIVLQSLKTSSYASLSLRLTNT